ncbi:alpha/beta hydrolase [Marinomonas sp. C2222]|uniref:Alpha/beta hydrolase n=1 Tax=Marinomonas sargassi TaxID=2984494 RepID=A0ABT2YQV8_9GAMM|nr:alpha/beta hydrolase [Marinomonas sargassi]MCV2402282.1 alpha/beta hydrolase [Marinomonas sargassi]
MTEDESLVMIHGLLGSLSYFEPTKYLSGMTTYLPDMYCYGDSSCLDNLSLQDQADYIEKVIMEDTKQPVWLLGHSVGGAVAVLLASKAPNLVKGIISVEGNFTLNDAFWCQKIANMDSEAWSIEYDRMRSSPENWLKESDIAVTPERAAWANEILNYQTALSIQKVAKAVISSTGSADYESKLESLKNSKIPMHLIAGEFSVEGWDVPKSFMGTAVSSTIMEKAGHMMMLEQPKAFCAIVQKIINGSI